jgi:uncharacterized protein
MQEDELEKAWQSKVVGAKTLSEWVSEFESFLLSIDEQYDPGHRIDHVRRAVNNALELASKEVDVNDEIVLPAIWLHDCVPISKRSKKRAMASQISADRAIAYLQAKGYPTEHLDAVHHAISAHSFSAGITPTTLEAKVVQDADRLDSLGAVGIARVFMLGGQFNNAIYHPEEPFSQGRELDEKNYVADHFFTKLLKLAPSFHTESGRQEAEKRTQYMKAFIQQLGGEIGVLPFLQAGIELV